MTPALIFGWLPVIGVIAGLSRARFARAPWIVAGVLVVAYLIYMAALGVYAGRCWDCDGLSGTRGETFNVGAIFFGIMLATTMLAIWLGARLTVVLGRLFGAARDVRDGLRERGDGRHADV
jgi:uncharacterized membrane protein